MGQTNIVVRVLFIVFNVLFMIAGCVLLVMTVKDTVDVHQEVPTVAGLRAMVWAWVLSFAIIVISALGAYGALKEKWIALLVFAILMGIAPIVMAAFCFQAVADLNRAKIVLLINPEELATLESVELIVLGIYFGLAGVALIGMLISILMVHQIKQKEQTTDGNVPMTTIAGGTQLMDDEY